MSTFNKNLILFVLFAFVFVLTYAKHSFMLVPKFSGRGHLYYPIEFKNGQYVPPEIKPYNTDVEDYYIIAMLMVGMQYEHYCTTYKWHMATLINKAIRLDQDKKTIVVLVGLYDLNYNDEEIIGQLLGQQFSTKKGKIATDAVQTAGNGTLDKQYSFQGKQFQKLPKDHIISKLLIEFYNVPANTPPPPLSALPSYTVPPKSPSPPAA